jgi:hypothetical protein
VSLCHYREAAEDIDVSEPTSHATIPSAILQGAVTMLHSIQRFPEERLVVIEVNHGAPVLIVWAHHVLGLSILLRTHEGGQPHESDLAVSPNRL